MKLSHLFLSLIALSWSVTVVAQSSIPLALAPYTFISAAGDTVLAELGSFQVPENRQRPEGKQLNLKFVRFKSTNPKPGPPIVYLAGGPGGSGINAAKYNRFKLFMSLRSVADVIAYDQRGTGLSDGPPRYRGGWMLDQEQPLTLEAARPSIVKATLEAATYFKESGTDLSAYNTNENADDLNDLRIALGAEKLSLWSISYGTHLALTTLKRHEAHLDKLILAGVEGYDQTVKMPLDQQRLLETIDSLLKASPVTASHFPDFLGDIEKLLAQLEQEPAIIKAKHPFFGVMQDVAFGKVECQILLASSLRGPATFTDMPLAVQEMLNGDFSRVEEFAFYPKMGNYRGMNMGMDLASGISKERRALLETQAATTLLGDVINFPYLIEYDALPDLDAGEAFRVPYTSEIPVLCISGTLDGRTPPNNAVETLRYLPNGKHLILVGAGHSDPLFLSSPRIEAVMLDFLNGKKVQDETIQLPPVVFELPE
ncbi:MAG: alpha/beta hydrolase [Bacteroidota bacterium]